MNMHPGNTRAWSALTQAEKWELVRPLREMGRSARQIANDVGAPSRNAILGLVFRCKDAEPANPQVSLFAAGPFQCRKPLWGDGPVQRVSLDTFQVCGRPVLTGKSYCPECCGRMFAREVKAG